MQQFLEAAAEGKLWTERDNVLNESNQQPYSSRSTKKNILRKSKSFESKMFALNKLYPYSNKIIKELIFYQIKHN